MGVHKEAKDGYQEAIQDAAQNGWRLVQIFASLAPTRKRNPRDQIMNA